MLAAPAAASDGGQIFVNGAGDAKIDLASGFVCPEKIGLFERDAVGESDARSDAAYCAYSALDGVYGAIVIAPLSGPYDPKSALTQDFIEQEGAGGRKIAEGVAKFGGAAGVYTRAYETATVEDAHYRALFAASAVGQWAVQATVEYASPRDDALERQFLDSVYAEALRQFALPR
ncbi:MAG TPA: hypothetical protein VHC42_03645 [Rhizomicrobium sp.]|nr:hypothetical protein [Rhizomicrobium sp.]